MLHVYPPLPINLLSGQKWIILIYGGMTTLRGRTSPGRRRKMGGEDIETQLVLKMAIGNKEG